MHNNINRAHFVGKVTPQTGRWRGDELRDTLLLSLQAYLITYKLLPLMRENQLLDPPLERPQNHNYEKFQASFFHFLVFFTETDTFLRQILALKE